MEKEKIQQVFYNAFNEHCYYVKSYAYLIDEHTVEKWQDFTTHTLSVNFYEGVGIVAQYRFTVTLHEPDKWVNVQMMLLNTRYSITGTQIECLVNALKDVRKVLKYDFK